MNQEAIDAVNRMERELEKLYPVLPETPSDAGSSQIPFSLS